jgi:hypothetical protein
MLAKIVHVPLTVFTTNDNQDSHGCSSAGNILRIA